MRARSDGMGLGAIPTGDMALDRILGGGLAEGSIVVVAGPPGSGKTVLAQQMLFANASADRPALYLTTYSEPMPKVVRYLRQFSFYDEKRMHTAVAYRDLGKRLRETGVSELPAVLTELVAEEPYAFLVIDSFKALHDLATEPQDFRLAVFDAAAHLASTDVTALWLGEYVRGRVDDYPEMAVADGVIEMENTSRGLRDERVLRVAKMRGRSPLGGQHTFRITEDGIAAFPRLVGADIQAKPQRESARIASGIVGFDELVDGGLWGGTSTLVLGPAGSGKTMLGATLLAEGAKLGEPGLLFTMQESAEQVAAIFAATGTPVGGPNLRVIHHSPLEADLVEIVSVLKARIEEDNVQRLVIDAVGDLRDAAIDPSRLRATLYNITHFCANHGVSVFLNTEMPLLHASDRFAEVGVSTMVDNVVLLRYGGDTGFEQTITIVKTRRSKHVPQTHRAHVDASGFRVGEPISNTAR